MIGSWQDPGTKTQTGTGNKLAPEPVDLTPLLDKFGFKYIKKTYGYYLLPDKKLNNDLFYLSLLKPIKAPGHGQVLV